MSQLSTCLVLRQRARTRSVRTFMQFEITVHPRGQVLLQWLLLLHRQDVWRNGLHFNKCLHSFSTQLGDWLNFYHLNLTLNPKRVDSVVIRNVAGLFKFQNVWVIYMVVTAISIHVHKILVGKFFNLQFIYTFLHIRFK